MVRRMKPRATGGKTKGSVTKSDAARLMGDLGPESHQAKGIPTTTWRTNVARQTLRVSLAGKEPSSVRRLESMLAGRIRPARRAGSPEAVFL
jgi:ATP-dependent exoDNAse (exonuclease V) alpha subunit